MFVQPRKTVGKLRDEDPLRRLERLNQFVASIRHKTSERSRSRKETTPFESVLASLSLADVRYLVVDGVACALNGFVRTTEVVDLLVDAEPENLRKLLQVLGQIGEGHARELMVEDFTDEEGAVQLVEDFPIDIFVRMGGKRFKDMLPYAKRTERDPPIPFVSAEGLILLKSGSPRPQDQIDVEALRNLRDSKGS